MMHSAAEALMEAAGWDECWCRLSSAPCRQPIQWQHSPLTHVLRVKQCSNQLAVLYVHGPPPANEGAYDRRL